MGDEMVSTDVRREDMDGRGDAIDMSLITCTVTVGRVKLSVEVVLLSLQQLGQPRR